MGNNYHKDLLHNMRLTKEKERIQGVIQRAIDSNSNIKSSDIFLKEGHRLFNPKVSHSERQQLFNDALKSMKVPEGIDVVHDHDKTINFKLEIPKESRIAKPVKESYVSAESMPYRSQNTYVNVKRMMNTIPKTNKSECTPNTIEKVDPRTKLPGNLFNKNSDKDRKFDSCIDQVSAKKGKNIAYAICRAALKKQQAIEKDDKPHPPRSPEAMAHDVAEFNKPFMDAVHQMKGDKRQISQFVGHLKTLVNKDQHRSAHNVRTDIHKCKKE